MTRRIYAGEITKEYLKKLGVEYVSPDGKYVIKNGKLAHISTSEKTKKPYGLVCFYDPDIRASVPFEERSNSTGIINLGIHVLNYVWNKGDRPEGMVIDHIDNDPTNNDISNLQCITQRENLTKERPDWNTTEMKCSMKKPRSFYEDKLINFEALYEAAKQEGNADLCHSLRANISQTRARIRYWDSHKNEYFEYIKQTELNKECKDNKKQSIKDRKILEQYKDMFRKNGNKDMWHQLCDIINKWDTLESMQKKHVFEVLNKHFTLAEKFLS